MKEIIISNNQEIVSEDTASRRYFEELPSSLAAFRQGFIDHDIYQFLNYSEKISGAFAHIGLTEVVSKVLELRSKCVVAKDLILYESEIRELLKMIDSAEPAISVALRRK